MPDAVHVQALEIVKTDVQTLRSSLQLFPDEVQVRKLDWDDVEKILGITVRFDGHPAEGVGTNERDMYGYRNHIIINLGHRDTLAEEPKAAFMLMQKCRRWFHNRRRMGGVVDAEVIRLPSTVRSGPSPPAKLRQNYDIYTLTVLTWFREPRDA